MNLLIILKNNIIENKVKFFLTIFLLSLLSRSIIAYYYGDRTLENEWSILVNNLYNFGVFSLLRFGDLFVPNLWMPPIYGYFIYLHTIFFGIGQSLVISVIISQIIISSFTPIIFYKITSTFFNKNLSLIGTLIFSLFPIIVFSASQISSVTIYLFLLLIFFYFFLEFCSSQAYRLAVLIAAISGILILTRRDFVLIYFFSIFFSYFFFKVNLKKILFIIMITIITISPYLIKNYLVFDKIIIHSGFGYNVWKAYNPNAKAEGYYIQSDDLKIKLDKIEKNVFYRINEDKVYLTKAKHYIKDEPSKYFKLFLNRIFSYYFIDLNSSQTNYFNQC